MAQGTIKKLSEKGYGFITSSTGKDLFFHMSAVENAKFIDLIEGQSVTFDEVEGPKGARAEHVKTA